MIEYYIIWIHFFLAHTCRVTQLALDEEGTENDGENETLISRILPIIDETDDMQFRDL